MRGRPPASPTARSTDPVTRRTSDGDRPVPSSVAALPPFSNQRGCLRCGARYEIRVHFDRDCAEVRGDHFHRVCPSEHRWVEPCSEGPMPTGSRLGGLNGGPRPRVERGFDFLGSRLSPSGLTVAEETLRRCVARAARLYEQGRGGPGGSAPLGSYVRRWTRWVRADGWRRRNSPALLAIVNMPLRSRWRRREIVGPL